MTDREKDEFIKNLKIKDFLKLSSNVFELYSQVNKDDFIVE